MMKYYIVIFFFKSCFGEIMRQGNSHDVGEKINRQMDI